MKKNFKIKYIFFAHILAFTIFINIFFYQRAKNILLNTNKNNEYLFYNNTKLSKVLSQKKTYEKFGIFYSKKYSIPQNKNLDKKIKRFNSQENNSKKEKKSFNKIKYNYNEYHEKYAKAPKTYSTNYYKDDKKSLNETHSTNKKIYQFDQNKNKEQNNSTKNLQSLKSECYSSDSSTMAPFYKITSPLTNLNIDNDNDELYESQTEKIEEILENINQDDNLMLDSILYQCGKNITSICKYIENHMRHIKIPIKNLNTNIDELVEFALKNKKGSALHYSALTYKLLDRAGYHVKIIKGNFFGKIHFWNEVEYGGNWYLIDTFFRNYIILEKSIGTIYSYLPLFCLKTTHL